MICFYKKGGDLNMSEPSISEICALVSGLRLPRWQDLPDLELYMDQVLSLVSRYLGSYPGFVGGGFFAGTLLGGQRCYITKLRAGVKRGDFVFEFVPALDGQASAFDIHILVLAGRQPQSINIVLLVFEDKARKGR